MDDRIVQLERDAAKAMAQLYQLECGHPSEGVSSVSHEPSKVFANKYKVRGLLLGVTTSAKSLLHIPNLKISLIWGFFTAKMAVNFIETEEPCEEARRRLLEVTNHLDGLKIVETCQFLRLFSGLLQFCYNSLAVVSDQRDAHVWLQKAATVFKDHKISVGENHGPPCWESLLGDPSDPRSALISETMFEMSYTTTLLMLAQAHNNDGERSKAAENCRETLRRQLHFAPVVDTILDMFGVQNNPPQSISSDDGENQKILAIPPVDWLMTSIQRFNADDWANNASLLSRYYAENCMYTNALECLLTARLVLARKVYPDIKNTEDGPCDGYAKLRGMKMWSEIARLTAEFSVRLLESGSKKILGSRFGVNINSDAEPASVCSYGSLFGESTNGMLLETLGQEIRDVNEAVFILSTIPEKYSSASCLFRWTARSIKTAMEYYKLNEQCSDAIDLIRCHARAYNYLASFEPNLSRKCCMQKRRADMLENLLDQLNPQYYMVACRQLMLDFADALTTLRDLNESKMQATTTLKRTEKTENEITTEMERYVRKMNGITRRALQVYEKFLASFKRPSDITTVVSYDEEWLKPVLMAHFYSARLHAKLLSGNANSRAKELDCSLREYRQMVSVADWQMQNAPQIVIPPEVEIAREMVNLIPAQIARIVAQGQKD